MFNLKRYFHDNTAFRYLVLYSSPTWSGVSTLNYGYAPVSDEVSNDPLARRQAYQIELYRQVFLAIGPLAPGQCLVEVSCGRGGGLAYIATRTPARCIGLEKSWPARRYARRLGLDARKAVAPALGLDRESVDAIISVEAFHNYAHADFLREAARCLRPGGVVVVADRRAGTADENRLRYETLFEANGFEFTAFRDITPNILQALRGDHARKAAFLRWVSGTFIEDELREMFACEGSNRYKAFESGAWSYFLFSATLRQGRGG